MLRWMLTPAFAVMYLMEPPRALSKCNLTLL